jgi:alpha-D-ribose 1-methylphosphonate 5-triphosphate synthase subunit PhnG
MSETAEPPVKEPPAQRFEDFMSDSIGAALKENPKMPAVGEPQKPEAEATPQEPKPDVSELKLDKPGPKADEKPAETDKNQLLPDFSKLAFGQEIAAKLPAPATSTKPELQKQPEIPSPEQFPEKLPGKTTPQVEQAFQSMRKSNKALWDQNAELTAKFKEAEAKLKETQSKLLEFDGKTPMATEEFDRLTNERDTLNQELRLAKLEATPEYKAAVSRPLEQISGEISRLSHKYSLNEHQVRRAITEGDPDKQSELLAQVTETFNDRDKLNLFKVADAAIEISRKRDLLHKDVKQALDYIEAKRTAETEAKTAATKSEWNSALSKAWDVIGEALYLARPLPGNDAWNNSLNDSKALVAKSDLATMTSVDRAKVLVQAALLPRACGVMVQLWNMYNEAATALKRYQGVTPGAGSGSSGVGTEPGAPAVSDETSFIDAIEHKMRAR